MPKKYEAIRDKMKGMLERKGVPEKQAESRAKTSAARIYNSQRKPGQKPVTSHT